MRVEATKQTERPGSDVAMLGLIALLVSVAYANSFQTGFALDDAVMIEQNVEITRLGSLPHLVTSDYWAGRAPSEAVPWRSGLYRPLVLVTFALNYAWGQLSPFGYHLVNVGLHLLVTWLVYLLARGIGISRESGGMAAVIFAVHPLHTEAVTGIVGRAELLMAAGVLGALWFAHLGRRSLSLLCFALALFSKEQAVVLPALLLLHDWTVGRLFPAPRNRRSLTAFGLAWYGDYVVVLLLYWVARWAALGHFILIPIPFLDNPLAHVDTVTRILSAIKVAGLYLYLCVWPAKLSADYSYNAIQLVHSPGEPVLLMALIAWGGLLALAGWSVARGDRRIGFTIGLMALSFLPISNLFLPIGTIMGERLFYLPSVGFCLLIGVACDRVRQHSSFSPRLGRWLPRFGLALVLVICTLLTLRTHVRNRDWMSTETLMRSSLETVPGSAKVHAALGGIAVQQADWEQALQHLQAAMNRYPEYTSTEVVINFNLGALLFQTGQVDEATGAFERAMRLDPLSSMTHFRLGLAYLRAQRFKDAEKTLRTSLTLNQDRAEAHNALSWLLNGDGRYEEALREAEPALRLGPDLKDAHINHARALEGLGRFEEAALELRRAGAEVGTPGFIGRRGR